MTVFRRGVRLACAQATAKKSRRLARAAKAQAIAPRPVAGRLRPAVRCSSVRYNRRVRAGRGFSVAELKEAKVSRAYAQTVGIAVDHRRRNNSVAAVQENVARLKQYMSKLVVFPRGRCARVGAVVPRRGGAGGFFLCVCVWGGGG